MTINAAVNTYIRHNLFKALVICTAFAAFAQAGVVKDHGRLKVSGNKIVDSLGKPIQVAGMSLYWPQWGGVAFYTDNAVSTLAKDWGCSLVRAALPVFTPNSNPNNQYDPKYIANVKTVIQAAINNDIYVMVDWHLEGDSPQPENAKAFFLDIAKTYGKYPHVIFELWNEPIKAGWPTIKNYSEDLLKLIRPYSSNLVIVGSDNWSKNLADPISSPVNDSNVAYTFHFYACTHTQTTRDFVTTSAAKIPIVFTEWGTTLASGTGSYCPEETDKWLALAKELGISWANWSFSNQGGLSGALTGTSLTGLSTSGQYVKGKIKEVTAALNSVTVTDTSIIPGRIEAEDFTSSSPELQVETVTDQGSGSGLGYTVNGSWTNYVVKVNKPGEYVLSARVATANSGTLTFKWNGTTLGTLEVASTGDWQSWQTKQIPVQISATGVGTLRMEWSGTATSLVNVNWVELVSNTTSAHFKVTNMKSFTVNANKNSLSLELTDGLRELSITDLHGRVLFHKALGTGKSMQIPLHAHGLVFVQARFSDGVKVLPVMLSR